MVRAIGYGKCGEAMSLALLAGCSDLGELASPVAADVARLFAAIEREAP